MAKENVDPVYKYIDGKIKLVRRELQQLKVAHDAVVAEQRQALLTTQRNIAAFIITSTCENTLHTLLKLKSKEADHLITQLTATASASKTSVKTSDDPISISAKFYQECYDGQEKLGVKIINLS